MTVSLPSPAPSGPGWDAVTTAIGEFLADADAGFLPTEDTTGNRIHWVWVDEHERLPLGQVIVDLLDARQCAGGCGDYLATDEVGHHHWCGEDLYYCSGCWDDERPACRHREHWE